MRILIAALISEGLLLTLGLTAVWALSLDIPWNISVRMGSYGVLLAIGPLVLNYYVWKRALASSDSVYTRFSQEIIIPLCRQISIPTAISVAILSGSCEEFFFRGVLSAAIARHSPLSVACLVSSVLFAAIHFVGSFKRFGGMMPLYTAMGIYMWLAAYLSSSLFCAAILHGSYNLAAILQIKFRDHALKAARHPANR
jgi:membrane protease YdiL (CAAX protease family)